MTGEDIYYYTSTEKILEYDTFLIQWIFDTVYYKSTFLTNESDHIDNIKLDLNLGPLSFVKIIFKSNISYHVINVVRIFDMCY